MKKNAFNQETISEEEEKKRQLEEKENLRHRALIVKEEMKLIDAEQLKNKKELLQDVDQQKSRNELQNRITSFQQDHIDEVKWMSQLQNDTRCILVREKQLEEKKNAMIKEIEEIKRLDLIMEVNRLKKVKEEEEKEQKKRELELAGRRVIIDQINNNHLKRLKELDEQTLEGQEMVAQTIKLQEDEKIRAIELREKKAEALNEILRINSNAMAHKKVLLAQEKEEDDKIMEYLKEKARKEDELQKELQRQHDLKEKEMALLREKQEKAMDRQMELDQLRARRAMHKEERNAREKEKREAEENVIKNRDLNQVRHGQVSEKQQKIYEQALKDKENHERMIQEKRRAIDKERALEAEKENTKLNYKKDLERQMMQKMEKKNLGLREKLEDGKKVRDKVEQEKAIIRAKHAEKVNGLLSEGLEPKFVAKFKSKKFI